MLWLTNAGVNPSAHNKPRLCITRSVRYPTAHSLKSDRRALGFVLLENFNLTVGRSTLLEYISTVIDLIDAIEGLDVRSNLVAHVVQELSNGYWAFSADKAHFRAIALCAPLVFGSQRAVHRRYPPVMFWMEVEVTNQRPIKRC